MESNGLLRSYTEYLWMETPKRKMLVHITEKVREIVRKSGIRDGFAYVGAMHITCAVWVNDNESGLHEDIDKWVEQLAPFKPSYEHHRTGEDNADAHLKSLILGRQTILPVTNGDLDLGPWERVFYHEFDGIRKKRIIVKVLGI